MKNNKKKKSIYIITIIIIITLIYVSSINKKDYLQIEKLFHEFGNRVENIFIPKDFTINKTILDGINKELETELNNLSELMGINPTNYSFIHSKVIERNIHWYQELIIDKGTNHGINSGMAVISNQGLIGRITKTTATTSIVKLLTSDDLKISIYIKNDTGDYHGIIDNYLEDENLIRANDINKNSDIKIGDKVYTTGLGEIYPAGIYIGEIVEINYDSLGLSKIVKIKTDLSYDKITYVSVVGRK